MTTETVLDNYQQIVLSNATVTSTGSSMVATDFGHKEVSLIINVTAAPTGTTPTITFKIQEVDPGNETTTIAAAVTGAAITAVGTQILTLPVTYGGGVEVSWVVSGTGPSFTGLYATLVNKGPSPAIYDQAGNGPVAVKAASTAVSATDPSLAVGLSPNSPLPTGTNTIGALTANQSVNLAQVGGTTTVTGGVAGTQGVGGLAAAGAAVAGNPVLVAGSDGTDARTMATDASGHPIIVGDGVAGTPAGGVVTVQGVSGGTTLPISGTTTANQGTANTLANAWPMEITDGTHGPAAVKAASTAAVATDAALVVAISPNNPIMVGAASDVTATGALGALNAAVSVTHPGLMAVGMQLAAGTLIGTVIAESSFDGGTTWNQTFFDSPATGAITSSLVFGSSNTATAETIVGVGGVGMTRVRVSAYTSGTANVTVRASDMYDPSVLFAGVSGSPVPPTAALVGGTDGTNLVPIRMKAASTAAVATDPAAVVSLSPNSPIPTGSNVIGSILAADQNGSGTITALNASVTATTAGCSSVSFDITGTWSATLTLQATNGDGNWHTISGTIPTSGTYTNTSTFTINQFVIVACGGYSQVRLTATAYTSGTATVQWNSGQGSNYLNSRVSINPDLTIIHNNATLTTSGQMVITGVGRKEISFGFTLLGTVSGTTPSLTFLVEEIDPVNQTTVMTLPGNSITLGPYTSSGHTNYQEMLSYTGAILVTWTVTGTTPSFGGLNSWVVVKEQSLVYGLTFAGGQNPLSVINIDTNDNTIVVGPAASGTAPGGSPVLVAGWDGTNVQTIVLKDASTAATATDPALVTAPSPNTMGPVGITSPNALASSLYAFPSAYGTLRVSPEPSALFADSFDTLDTLNRWTQFQQVGGTQSVTNGVLSINTTTTASVYSGLASIPTFTSIGLGFHVFVCLHQIDAAVLANSYQFWGVGTHAGVPSTTAPLTDAVGFELTTAGALNAVVWAGGTKISSTTLTRPSDGAFHRYRVIYRDDQITWYLDSLEVPVATVLNTSPNSSLLPVLLMSVNATSGPASAPTAKYAEVGLADSSHSNSSVSDGVFPWRQATVKAASIATTTTDLALTVGLHPSSNSVTGAAATGAAVTGNPVLSGGSDGTDARTMLTDTSGRQIMVGAAADGAAIAGNPVLMAGQDGTDAQSILTDTTGRQVMVGAAATGAAVTGNPVLMAGSDGTDARSVATDANGQVRVIGPTRNRVSIVFQSTATATADTLLSLVKSTNGTAAAGATSIAVAASKTLHITSMTFSIKTGAAAVSFATFTLRINPSGAAVIGSQSEFRADVTTLGVATGDGQAFNAAFPDGFELSGTSQLAVSAAANATTTVLSVALNGYEY